MDRRALLVRLATAPLLPLALSGCLASRELTLGIHPWPGYEPLYLARHFGWLPESVRLQEGRNASDSLAGLHSGVLDGAALTLDEVLIARAQGLPLTVILVLDGSVGADVLLTRPGITTLAELRGARIAVESSAVGQLMLTQACRAAGLAPDDLVVLDIPPDRQLVAWRAGEIDAAISYEPSASRLEREGAQRRFDSGRFPELILDVLALRHDRLRRRGASIEGLVAGYFQGLTHLRLNREDAMRRIAAWRGLSYPETKASFEGMALPDRNGNRRYFGPAGALTRAARELNPLLVRNGSLTAPDDLMGLMTDRYLEGA